MPSLFPISNAELYYDEFVPYMREIKKLAHIFLIIKGPGFTISISYILTQSYCRHNLHFLFHLYSIVVVRFLHSSLICSIELSKSHYSKNVQWLSKCNDEIHNIGDNSFYLSLRNLLTLDFF